MPRLTAREIIAMLRRHGFTEVRSSGSHRIFRNKIGRRTTVPFHPGKILHPKLLKSILKDADIAADELE